MATIELYQNKKKVGQGSDSYITTYIGVSSSDTSNTYRAYYKISNISPTVTKITEISLDSVLRVTNGGQPVTADYDIRIYTNEDDAIALNNNYKSQVVAHIE